VWVSVYTYGGNGTGCLGLPSDALDEAPASPFIASKQKARVTTVVVNDRGKEERKKKQDGVRSRRPYPLPAWASVLVERRRSGRPVRASLSTDDTCSDHFWSYRAVLSRLCARIRVERG
jgi:hypothetical protein